MSEAYLEDVQVKAKGFLADGFALKESMDEFSEWNSWAEIRENINDISNFILSIIVSVEKAVDAVGVTAEGIKSEEKLEAACQILDDAIDLPWYLEAVDGLAFNLLISQAVSLLNKQFGNEWDFSKIDEFINKGKEVVERVEVATS